MEVMEHCNSKEVCFLLKCAVLKNASSILLSGLDFMLYYLHASPYCIKSVFVNLCWRGRRILYSTHFSL